MIDRNVLVIARRAARELAAGGAVAVVLTGSHARGDAHPRSDIDLVAVYERTPSPAPPGSAMRGGRHVTIAAGTAAAVRASFRSPQKAPTHVPGWRQAVVLHDPDGVAADLQRRALAWRWAGISDDADEYVAEEIVGLAEEVYKLARALETGAALDAGVQRSVIALRLAGVMGVHRRMLYGSENGMWDAVAEAMGAEWTAAQHAALSANGEPLEVSCCAALGLYALAASTARALFDRRQRAVVDAAVELANTLI